MASHVFAIAKQHFLEGKLDITDDATHDFRAKVVPAMGEWILEKARLS